MKALLKVVFVEHSKKAGHARSGERAKQISDEHAELYNRCVALLTALNFRVYETPNPRPNSFNVTLNHQPVYSRHPDQVLATAEDIVALVRKEKKKQIE